MEIVWETTDQTFNMISMEPITMLITTIVPTEVRSMVNKF